MQCNVVYVYVFCLFKCYTASTLQSPASDENSLVCLSLSLSSIHSNLVDTRGGLHRGGRRIFPIQEGFRGLFRLFLQQGFLVVAATMDDGWVDERMGKGRIV